MFYSNYGYPVLSSLQQQSLMSPKHVFKTNESTICIVKVNACLVIEEKKDLSSPIFWLDLLACILLLFVCSNKHYTHKCTKNLKLCCKFMFRQILLFKFRLQNF